MVKWFFTAGLFLLMVACALLADITRDAGYTAVSVLCLFWAICLTIFILKVLGD
jgi:hypothetical protein